MVGLVFFFMRKRGRLRVSREAELQGLDLFHHREVAFPESAEGLAAKAKTHKPRADSEIFALYSEAGADAPYFELGEEDL